MLTFLSKTKNMFSSFEVNHNLTISYFNIFSTVAYWSWQPLNERLTGHPNIEGFRWLIVLFSIALHMAFVKKKIDFPVSNILLQLVIITHFSFTIYLNKFHIVYIIGFILLLVLQGLTFKHKKYLFIFFGYSLILTLTLGQLAENNQKLFLWNALTVFVMGPLIALIQIRDSERITQQNDEISKLKIDQANNKVQKSITNFSSSLAHEINTPLTTILGYTDLLNSILAENKTEDKKFISKIETQIKKIKEITEMLGLLSSDPKQNNSDNSVINSSDVSNYITNHVEKKINKSKVSFEFFQNQEESYILNKGQMFYILNEIFSLFPNEKNLQLNILVNFKKDRIEFLTDCSVNLQINDLNTMTAQVISNNYNFRIDEHKEETKKGIVFYKEVA